MALTIGVQKLVLQSSNPLLGVRPHWSRVRLGDIGKVLNGFAFSSSQFSRDQGTPLIRIRDIGMAATDIKYLGEYDPRYLVHRGDLLVGMDGDFNCARWRGAPGLLNQRVCRLSIDPTTYEPKLLDYVLPGYLRALNAATSSMTVKHLSSRSLADIPLPLPPLAEQRSMVSEIEKQFSRLDEAVSILKRVKTNLKRCKAAVLKAAIEGRLVVTEAEQARREGRELESGAEVLTCAQNARRQCWSGRGTYAEPIKPDLRELPEPPDGWAWASADQLSDFITKGTTPATSNLLDGSGDVQFLKVYNLTFDGSLNRTFKPAYVSREIHEGELARSRVVPGDVLINIVGPPLGQVSVVPEHMAEANINQAIARIRPVDPVLPRFVAIALLCEDIMQRVIRRAKTTAGQSNLTLELCRSLPIPIPPVAEQHRIVAEVDRRLSIVREVEAEVNANLKRAQSLRQAILAKAFGA